MPLRDRDLEVSDDRLQIACDQAHVIEFLSIDEIDKIAQELLDLRMEYRVMCCKERGCGKSGTIRNPGWCGIEECWNA